jgi:hypothetical protein
VDPPADPPVPFTKTPADFEALELALANERKNHAKTAAKVKASELAAMSEAEQTWQAKVDEAAKGSDAKLVKIAARSALAAAGLAGKPDKLVALLDLDAVTVDDDGVASGLEKQIATMKADYPGLFAVTPSGPGHLNIGSRPGPKPKPRGYADQLAEQLMGSQ